MARTNHILITGAARQTLESVRDRLEGRGFDVELVDDSADCVRRFSGDGADLVIACLPLKGAGGVDLVRGLREIDPRVTVVMAGCDHQVLGAAEAFSVDAFEYLEELPQNMNDLLAAVGGALGSRRGDAQLRYMRQRESSRSGWASVVGTSTEMRDVVDTVRRVSERTTRGMPPTILIRGETGTGKGLLAKCIHYNGVRRNQALVELNCAAIPSQLLESELFGYERGAFTDAKTSKAGLFETAHLGTLFLDEIGSLTIDLQAKLLTAIEEKRIRRLGGRHSVQVDVQIIAAAHADLSKRVQRAEFREDLYHRLNVVSVMLPPLRRRGQDKLILARAFIETMSREYGMPTRTLTSDAEEYIMAYGWPGNVRELRNQVERVLLLASDGASLGRGDFDRPSTSMPPPSDRPASAPVSLPAEVFSAKAFSAEGLGLEEIERELIKYALARFEGNVSQAARHLKVSRQTLIYRIRKHELA